MDESIYRQPNLYDLEHAGVEPDIGFYSRLVDRWKASRILELGCGSGRVTIPLARRFRSRGPQVTGLDATPEMLAAAREKSPAPNDLAPALLTWVEGDLRTWRSPDPFDLILAPGGTLSHLLTLEDQRTTWQTAFQNLRPGGRFVAEVSTPDLPAFAESMQQPPRAVLELDRDASKQGNAGSPTRRLLRCKAVLYDAVQQKACVHFFYDKFNEAETAEATRYLTDYEHHVYYPRELELLFLLSGFEVESVWGDYAAQPLRQESRSIIVVGRKLET